MTRLRPASVINIVGIVVLLGAISLGAQPVIKHETARRAQSLEGQDTFNAYCAVCHGADGKGAGPAASALKTPPTDLTTYAQRHAGTFSAVDMREVINGERLIPAHGTREMPIWGDVFRALYTDLTLRDLLIRNLIVHIESMQAK